MKPRHHGRGDIQGSLGRQGRIVALAVVAISLAGLAMLRGSSHVEEHLHHHGGLSRGQGGSGHAGANSRHLGFHHPDRDSAVLTHTNPATGQLPAQAKRTPPAYQVPIPPAHEAAALDGIPPFPSASTMDAGLSTEPVTAEPPKGTPEWDLYHIQSRSKKHDANKKRRQLEKAAIGFTIASSKVAAAAVHLNAGPGVMESIAGNIKRVNGAYKFTGSGALGDKAARLAAAAYLNATKVSSLEELDAVIAELSASGQLTADVNSMGPADTGYEVDDNSSCQGLCGKNGWCRRGKCECVALYLGEHCDVPREMPEDMHADFEGNYIFNRARLRDLNQLVLKYTTNPKASGGSHSFTIPITRDMVRLSPARDPLATRVYESCAIVGSSGILNHYRYGTEIDSASLVIRFNLAPTSAFKDQVGVKTNLRFVNTVHAGYHERAEIGVMQMQSQVGLQLYLKFRRDHPTERILAFDTDFSRFVSSNVRTLPTGGYFAIWLALSRCKQVTVYGFNFASGYGVPHHYFNEEKPKKGKAAIHDYELEHRLIVQLAAARVMEFAEPCVAGCTERTGVSYRHLSPGGTCQCDTGNPLPVALPGFCRPPGTFMCFVKCPGGVAQCPGGVHLQAPEEDPTKHSGPVDGDGDCPQSLLPPDGDGGFVDFQGMPVQAKCAMEHDL